MYFYSALLLCVKLDENSKLMVECNALRAENLTLRRNVDHLKQVFFLIFELIHCLASLFFAHCLRALKGRSGL